MRTLTLAFAAITIFGCSNDDELRQMNAEPQEEIARPHHERETGASSTLTTFRTPKPRTAVATPGPTPNLTDWFWKTVMLGGHKSVSDIRIALNFAKIKISSYANDVLDKTPLASTPASVDLVKIAVGELGFPQGATIEGIYASAKALGLELCPAEAGPALRLADQDQQLDEWVVVGMKPITNSDGDPSVFSVERRLGGLWLFTRWAEPLRWSPDSQFVFCRRPATTEATQ